MVAEKSGETTPFTSPSAVDVKLLLQLGFEEEVVVAPESTTHGEVPPARSVLNFRTLPRLSGDECDNV